jgi:quinolinate synthase
MVAFCKSSAAETFIVVTESGMLHRLEREIPEKTFIAGPTDKCACSDCRFMKLNTLEKLRDCLKKLEPRIELPADVMAQARVPIQRMLEWSR